MVALSVCVLSLHKGITSKSTKSAFLNESIEYCAVNTSYYIVLNRNFKKLITINFLI